MINCPRCSANLNINKNTLINCSHCGSSFVLERGVTQQSLIHLKQKFTIRNKSYQTIGQQVQTHDDGTRIDWLITDKLGNKKLLMIDDENIALVDAIPLPLDTNLNWNSLLPNTQCQLLDKSWLVTEKKAFNKVQRQTYLSNQNAELLILSFTPQQTLAQQGKWLDIFEIINEN